MENSAEKRVALGPLSGKVSVGKSRITITEFFYLKFQDF